MLSKWLEHQGARVAVLGGSVLVVVIGLAVLLIGSTLASVAQRGDAADGAPGDALMIVGLVVALLGVAMPIALIVARTISRRRAQR